MRRLLLLLIVLAGSVVPAAAGSAQVLLGDQNVESTRGGTYNSSEAFGYTASTSGTAQSISVYLTSTHGVRVALYADSAATPGARLATGSVTNNTAGWVTIPLSGSVSITSGTRYWLAIASNSNHGIAYRDKGSSGSNLDWSLNGLANPAVVTSQKFGNPASVYLNGSPVPPPPVAPSNTTAPAISGTPQQGNTLTVSNGTWTGDVPITYAYQWQDCAASTCQNITGATSPTYALTASDVGSSVDAVVTATNTAGAAQSTSNTVGPVTSSGSPSGGPCNGCSWNGDYSTGDFSQYDDCNAGTKADGNYPSHYAIDTLTGSVGPATCGGRGIAPLVNDIAPPSGFPYAFRSTLDSGASPPNEPGEISDLGLFPTTNPANGKSRAYQGATTWYRDEMYFPSSWAPSNNTAWNWVWEMHNAPDGPCCAHLALSVDTDNSDGGSSGGQRLSLRVEGGGTPSQPVDTAGGCAQDSACVIHWIKGPDVASLRGQWLDVVMRVTWDYRSIANGGVGSVDYYVNGTKIGSYSGPTLYYYSNVYGTAGPNEGYLMLGDYRPTDSSAGYSQPATNMYHAATMLGPTAASVGENLP